VPCFLSLTLFVLLVGADHPDHAGAADNLALVANFLDGRSYFHRSLRPLRGSSQPPKTISSKPAASRQFQTAKTASSKPDERSEPRGF
jgi:hypothetical protein